MATCIIIPAYNAAEFIADVAREALQTGFPLLVVDDGSRDGTADCLNGLPVELVIHRENLGKGMALRSGFAWALKHGFAGAVTMDGDGQHDPSAIPLLAKVAAENGLDILIASRAEQFRQMSGLRSTWNRFGSWCMETRTGFVIDDSQSGFRYYSARLLRGVELRSAGYELEMEVLLKAWRCGFRIDSIPVSARVADGRATSHFRAFRDTWNICMTFLRYM